MSTGSLVAACFGALLGCSVASAAGANDQERPVAWVADKPITEGDLELALAQRLSSIKAEEYQVRRQALDDLIADRLIALEASARGITASALAKEEIDGKAVPTTKADAAIVYEAVGERFGPDRTAAMSAIERMLQTRRLNTRRVAFLEELRIKYGVRSELCPWRTEVSSSGQYAAGMPEAPILVVEFSDYQCPFCRELTRTLSQVLPKYEGQVRRIFHDYPLPNHPDARTAALAAACADDQGAFWRMHDRLFEMQADLSPASLQGAAVALGLNGGEFRDCLISQKHEQRWRASKQLGESYGVATTPSVFVNGRMIVGAQPAPAYIDVIDQELRWQRERSVCYSGGGSR